MNKYISYTLLLLLFGSCITYQTVQFNEPFQKTWDNLNESKETLFVKSNNWMIQTFNDAESVIQFSDKEEGVITGKYLMFGNIVRGSYGASADTRVYAIIKIQVKDNKARITITPANEWKYDKSGMTIYTYAPEQARQDMSNLALLFYAELNKTVDDF